MESSNRVTNTLGIDLPIIQAAMSWITDAKMVAAVSNGGGMGVLGPNAGAKSDGNIPISTADRLRKEIRKIKALTDKPFAINIHSPAEGEDDSYTQTVLKASLEEGAKHFVSVGTVNRNLFKQIKDVGAILIHRELTPTPELAKKAEEAGADLIIATGYDEGGWIPQNQIGTFSIVPTIVDAVSIPVIATGGINDIRGVRAAFALGAEGVYVGTRFIVSEESPASEITKGDIIDTNAHDLVFVSSMQRSTPHKFANELAEMYKNGVSSHELEQKIALSGTLRPGMLEGNIDEGIVSVNTAIDLIKEVKSCKDIIDELMADFLNK